MRSVPVPRAAASKIASPARLRSRLRQARRAGCSVVFTNGCFDLLHAGHVRLLEWAKRQGDLLVVGINSDRSVRRLKGPGRPLVAQRHRALLLAALQSVDYVTVFDAPTPHRLISQVQPDVLIKGGDWRSDQIVGRDVVHRRGGRVLRFPVVRGFSTSQLLARIRRHG